MIEYEAILERDGKTATGITVPQRVMDALGGGKRPPVRVNVNGHAYASTVGTMGGVASENGQPHAAVDGTVALSVDW